MAPYIQTKEAFVELGNYLTDFCEKCYTDSGDADANFLHVIDLAQQQNGWFTKENILFSLNEWGKSLTDENIRTWLANYDIQEVGTPKTVGIVMAGNIPLVGFHDFMCVLLSGHKVLAKLSSNDKVLLPFLAKYLIQKEPSLSTRIQFVEGKMEGFDAVIATGSNNTSRYFEYYFGKKPNIIRRNRNSVAIITGNENQEELETLGEDIFRYFGLGCRNVSKIFVPEEYDFEPFFNAIYLQKEIINHHKYANNYDYNKAVYLMSDLKILDNGFMVLKEDTSFSSPISVLFYEQYSSLEDLKKQLQEQEDQIQCVVSHRPTLNEVGFGDTQKPKLHDYADGVDTLEFLLKL